MLMNYLLGYSPSQAHSGPGGCWTPLRWGFLHCDISLDSEQEADISRTLLVLPETWEEFGTFWLCNKPGIDPCADRISPSLGLQLLSANPLRAKPPQVPTHSTDSAGGTSVISQ